MAELKTKKNETGVMDFINAIQDEAKRKDSLAILKLMRQVTKKKPKMWGESIVGFGKYHYKYASGREGDWFATGFSPRKQNLTIYIMGGLDQHKALLKKLGKHSTGMGCVYVKKLEDVNVEVLQDLIAQSVKGLAQK